MALSYVNCMVTAENTARWQGWVGGSEAAGSWRGDGGSGSPTSCFPSFKNACSKGCVATMDVKLENCTFDESKFYIQPFTVQVCSFSSRVKRQKSLVPSSCSTEQGLSSSPTGRIELPRGHVRGPTGTSSACATAGLSRGCKSSSSPHRAGRAVAAAC